MCCATIATLSLTSLLHDPMVALMMQADNIAPDDHATLLLRVQQVLLARNPPLPYPTEAEAPIE